MGDCRRCGDCCRAYPCAISWVLFNPHSPEDFNAPVHRCPALTEEADETTTCGVFTNPEDFIDLSEPMIELFQFLIHEHLAIGEGCGAQSPRGRRLVETMRKKVKTSET